MDYQIIRLDLNGVNCYLAKSREDFLLFDTGGHLLMDIEFTDRRQMLTDLLVKEGCKPGNLKAIILTHGDCDHSANAAFLKDKFRTVVAMHQADSCLVKDLTIDKMMANFKFRSTAYKFLSVLIRTMINKKNRKVVEDFTGFIPDVLLKDGDDLTGYGFPARVIHIPGHTEGSIAVLFEGGELIAGDTFAFIKKPSLAPNALNFTQLKSSVLKLRKLNISMIYPGHGKPFEFSKSAIATGRL